MVALCITGNNVNKSNCFNVFTHSGLFKVSAKLLKDDLRMHTCRAIIFDLRQVAGFKDHHRQGVGS